MAFEEFQLETPEGRGFITQRESKPGVPDITALPTRRKDISTDGNGFDPVQRFVEHLPDGFSAPIGVGLLGDEGTFGGNFMPRYGEIPLDMPLVCGKNRLTTSTLGDGRRKRVWAFPNGTRDIETVTGWFGADNRCWLLQYGKMMTWVVESERTGETGGNKSYHFNQGTRNQPLPVTVAQNTILSVSAAGVTGDGVFSLRPLNGTAQNVTFSIGDTVAQTVAKFAAIGLTVAVGGTVAAAAGEVHTLVGANLVAGQTATIYGIVVVNPSTSTPASVQTAVRALGGSFALRAVTGTITAPGTVATSVASGGVAASTSTSNSGSGVGILFDGSTAQTPWVNLAPGQRLSYIFNGGATKTITQWGYAISGINGNTAVPNSMRLYSIDAQGVRTLIDTKPGAGTFDAIQRFTIPAVTASGFEVENASTSNTATLTEVVFEGVSLGAVALTITVPASEGNVADIETVPGTGYVGTSTPPGTASGTLAITVNAPAQTQVSISKVSGNGWSASVTQAGSDGTGPTEVMGSFIEATHWTVYKAATKAALDAIDYANPGNALVKTATGHTFSIENLAQVVYLEDGKVNPGSHVTRRPNATASLTLAVQTALGTNIDYAEDIYATENLGGCGVNPFWLRFRAQCGGDEFWIDGKWARNQQAAHPAQEGLAQWQFPLIRIHDAAGSLFFTVIDAG